MSTIVTVNYDAMLEDYAGASRSLGRRFLDRSRWNASRQSFGLGDRWRLLAERQHTPVFADPSAVWGLREARAAYQQYWYLAAFDRLLEEKQQREAELVGVSTCDLSGFDEGGLRDPPFDAPRERFGGDDPRPVLGECRVSPRPTRAGPPDDDEPNDAHQRSTRGPRKGESQSRPPVRSGPRGYLVRAPGPR